MSQSILLRTLTRKSQIKFGKYADCTVQEVLGLGWEGKDYLIWIYYNVKGISYNEELMDLFKITKEFRIDKPGKNGIMLYTFKDATYSEEKSLALWHRTNKKKKAHSLRKKIGDSKSFSKGNMQKRNQGKNE